MTIAKNYANERTAFGKPIGKFEGIQFKFADMSAEIRAMELMTYDTARMKAEGKRHTLEAAQTKLFSGVHCTQILPRVPAGPRRQRLQQGVPRGALRPRRQAA